MVRYRAVRASLPAEYSPYQLGYAARQRGRGFNLMPWLKRAGSIVGPAIANWSGGDKPMAAVGKALKSRLQAINESAPSAASSKAANKRRGSNKKKKKKPGFRKLQ
jgi:hypothetical protein